MAITPDDIGTNIVPTDQPARPGNGDRMMISELTSYDAKSGSASRHDPTVLAYGHLVAAYGFFNEHLFAGSLPGCLITMQRKKGARGFFHGSRFGSRDQTEITDEIALNPATFAMRDDKGILSTLVHEMAHLWQHHFGKPPSTSYHNREWAAKMVELGLTPSHTGKSGGRQTGRRVTHFIQPGGLLTAFAKHCCAPASSSPMSSGATTRGARRSAPKRPPARPVTPAPAAD